MSFFLVWAPIILSSLSCLNNEKWLNMKRLIYRLRRIWARNMRKIYYFVPSKKSLGRETDTKKSWAILQNFNFGKLELTKTPILPNCQVPNGFFVNLIIQEVKFFKIAKLFIVSVSLVGSYFEGTGENILHIFGALVIWMLLFIY